MSEHRRPFDWISNKEAAQYFAEAARHAALHPEGRTCFHRSIKGDGLGTLRVEVCEENGEAAYAFNDTFQCPPVC